MKIAGTISMTRGKRLNHPRQLAKAKKEIPTARSDGDTSTKFFVVWKTSAGIFPGIPIHHPKPSCCQVPRW
jgi:hypothetical protein